MPTETPTPTPTLEPTSFPYPTTQYIDVASDSAFAIGISDYMRSNLLFNGLVLFVLFILLAMYVYKR